MNFIIVYYNWTAYYWFTAIDAVAKRVVKCCCHAQCCEMLLLKTIVKEKLKNEPDIVAPILK